MKRKRGEFSEEAQKRVSERKSKGVVWERQPIPTSGDKTLARKILEALRKPLGGLTEHAIAIWIAEYRRELRRADKHRCHGNPPRPDHGSCNHG